MERIFSESKPYQPVVLSFVFEKGRIMFSSPPPRLWLLPAVAAATATLLLAVGTVAHANGVLATAMVTSPANVTPPNPPPAEPSETYIYYVTCASINSVEIYRTSGSSATVLNYSYSLLGPAGGAPSSGSSAASVPAGPYILYFSNDFSGSQAFYAGWHSVTASSTMSVSYTNSPDDGATDTDTHHFHVAGTGDPAG